MLSVRRRTSTGAPQGILLVIVLLMSITAGAFCSRKKTSCDGLEYKTGGLTRAEYLPCAGEMIAALDRLRPDLEAFVQGDKTAGAKIRTEYGDVRSLLVSAVRIDRNLVDRWEDDDLNRLNVRIWNAYTSYGAVVFLPNATDLTAGEDSHDQAKSVYQSLR
jgi:hypothetical protein